MVCGHARIEQRVTFGLGKDEEILGAELYAGADRPDVGGVVDIRRAFRVGRLQEIVTMVRLAGKGDRE